MSTAPIPTSQSGRLLLRPFVTTVRLVVTLALALCTPIAAEAQQPNEKPFAWGLKQLDGVLTCTLKRPELLGDAEFDSWNLRLYEQRLDRIIRLVIKDEGRAATVFTPLAPRNDPIDLIFVANRNVYNLFIEKSDLSSSVFAVTRGMPEGGTLGKVVHMGAALDEGALRYECSWVPSATR